MTLGHVPRKRKLIYIDIIIPVHVHFLRKNLVSVLVAYTSNSYEDFKQKSQYDSGALMGKLITNLSQVLKEQLY